MKKIIVNLLSLVIVFIAVVFSISYLRSTDKNYACTGYSNGVPRVFSLHYDRHFSALVWSDWGWAHVTLKSADYDFAGAYYFNSEGKLNNSIVDANVFFYQDKDTIHASTGLDTPRMKEVSFNLSTKVISFKDRAQDSKFEGICID